MPGKNTGKKVTVTTPQGTTVTGDSRGDAGKYAAALARKRAGEKSGDSPQKLGYIQKFGAERMSPGKMGDMTAAKMAHGDSASKYYDGAGMYMNGAPKYVGAAKNGGPIDPKPESGRGSGNPTVLQSIRNFTDPGYKATPATNSSRQLFDADGDGDTMFNDSNNDGTMLSRGLKSVRSAIKSAYNKAFPAPPGGYRPMFKDGKLNFDASLMDSVGTGMDKRNCKK